MTASRANNNNNGSTAPAVPAATSSVGSSGSGNRNFRNNNSNHGNNNKANRTNNNNTNNNKGSSKRSGKRNNRPSGNRGGAGGGGGGPKGPPPPPNTKITFRNIGNVEAFGSVASTLEMIRSMVQAVNEHVDAQQQQYHDHSTGAKMHPNGGQNSPLQLPPPNFYVQLDEASIARLIQEEALVRDAGNTQHGNTNEDRNNQDHNDPATRENNNNNEEVRGPSAADTGATNNNDNNNPTLNTAESTQKTAMVDIKTAKKDKEGCAAAASVLQGRVLFVVPPKKTRRRGDKTGCVYMVLTSPRIEPVDTTAAVAGELNNDAASTTTATTTTTAATQGPEGTYARAMAEGRLLLLQALEAFQAVADQDSVLKKTSQDSLHAACVVEASLSGKTWKPLPPPSAAGRRGETYPRRDKREGTIEETADYKNFLEGRNKQEEELKARPRPTPGGTAAAIAIAADGSPMAALVLHLRAKREEAAAKRHHHHHHHGSKNASNSNKTSSRSNKRNNKNKEKTSILNASSVTSSTALPANTTSRKKSASNKGKQDAKKRGTGSGGAGKDGSNNKRKKNRRKPQGGGSTAGSAPSAAAPSVLKAAPSERAPTGDATGNAGVRNGVLGNVTSDSGGGSGG